MAGFGWSHPKPMAGAVCQEIGSDGFVHPGDRIPPDAIRGRNATPWKVRNNPMKGLGWSHPRPTAGAGSLPHRSPLARGPAAPPLPRPIAAFGPLRTVCRFHPRGARRERFSEILPKNGHLAYTGLATWQWVRPSLLDSLYLIQLSNLRKLWNLGLINKGRES